MTAHSGIKRKIAAALALCAACLFSASCGGSRHATVNTDTGVGVRDPYVLEYGGVYYMYGTGLKWDGHGMLFTAPDGTLTLSIHSPNTAGENDPTTALFVPVDDIGDTLIAKDDNGFFTRAYYRTGSTTRLAIADATDENWPATLEYMGTAIPDKHDGDSADVKYLDEYGRFIAVFTEKRFSTESYVAVWESFDGLHFRPCDIIKANTAKNLHNCGISGRADGHIGKGDPVYLGYGYGVWGGIGWPTRLHALRLSLGDAAITDDAAEENVEMEIVTRPARLISDSLTVKAEKPSYVITGPTQLWVMAYDSDGYVFPVLVGTRFYGYDRSVIRMVGGMMIPVGEGTTRVFLDWHGIPADCLVTVTNGG